MKHIDNLFKEELGSYTETPPPPAWDALEKRLNESRNRRRFPVGWFWYIGVVSIIVLLGASVLWRMEGVNNYTKIAQSTTNVISKPQDVVTTTTVKSDNSTVKNNDRPQGKYAKAHHNIKAISTDNVNETKRIAIRKAKKKNSVEPSSTTQNNSNKTNDELYADVDDDQYTVGYSSNTRKNTGPSAENDADVSDYIITQSSHNNIAVAEMQPQQHVRETNYGSRTSIADQNIKTASKEKSIPSLNNNHTLAHDRQHKHAATTAHAIVHTTAIHKVDGTEMIAATVPNRKRSKTRRVQVAAVNIVAASTPIVKTNNVIKAIVAPTNQDEHKLAKKTNSQAGNVSAISESSNTASARVIKEKATKQAVAVIPAKTEEVITVKNTNSEPSKNNIPANKPANNNVADNIAATNKKENKTHRQLPENKKDKSVVSGVTNDNIVAAGNKAVKKEAVVSKQKKETPTTASLQNKKTNTGAVSNHVATKVGIASNTTHKTVEPPQLVVPGNKIKPVKDAYASGSSIKNTHKQRAAYKEKPKAVEQKSIAASVSKKTIAKDNGIIPSGKAAVAKNKPAGNKQQDIKGDKQMNASAASAINKNPIKDKEISTGKTVNKASKETASAKEKHIGKANPDVQLQSAEKKETAVNKAIANNDKKTAKTRTGRKASTSGNNTTGNNATKPAPLAPQPPANVFSNSFSKRTIEDDAATIDNLAVNNFSAQQPVTNAGNGELIPGTFKQDINVAKPDSVAKVETIDSTKHHSFTSRFEAGIKGGYETGFNKNAANKFVVTPYIQYNLTDKFAIMTQPGVKASHVSSGFGATRSYFDTSKGHDKVTNMGDSSVLVIVGGVTGLDTIGWMRHYAYSQQYESIIKSYNYGGTYYEFELPILFKYKIIPQLSVYGGVNMVYSKYVSIKENTSTSGPITKYDTASVPAFVRQSPPLPPSIGKVITYTGAPIASYTGPLYPSPQGDLLRFGYMLGFSYEYKKRWLFDVLVQQAMVKSNNEGGYNTNEPLALPYFRFTLGYKLTK